MRCYSMLGRERLRGLEKGRGGEGEFERGVGWYLVLKHSRRANHLERSVTLLVRVQLGRGQGAEGIEDWNRYLNLSLNLFLYLYSICISLYLSLPLYLCAAITVLGRGRHAGISPSHFNLHFTLCLVAVSALPCPALLSSTLLYAALLCSALLSSALLLQDLWD